MKDVVKLKRARSGTGGTVTSLGVPKEIADALELVNVDMFKVELTEDGILFRPMTSAPEIVKPTWLTGTRGVRARRAAAALPAASEATG